jgi:23S rRNA (cytosine1962-C5)-methyltransferase
LESIQLFSEPWYDYELLDAGGGKKLERFGEIILIRPERQAYFKSGLTFDKWYELAHWEFIEKPNQTGKWKNIRKDSPKEWLMQYRRQKIQLELTKFKHIGIFPEQEANWKYIVSETKKSDKILNLFAYTGVASLVARSCEAEVVHVDSVKQLITWANHNAELNLLSGIKWVLEDALKFAQREVKRGNKYDGIIMDPPAFGIGPKGEKWILEEKISFLLETAIQLLKPNGYIILNTYSPKISLETLLSISNKFTQNHTFDILELWSKSKTEKELFHGNLLRSKKNPD